MRIALLAAVGVIAATGALARAQADSRFTEHPLPGVPPGVEVQGGIAFAPDGSQVAFVGKKGGKSVPVVGTNVLDAYWHVGAPRFGADARVAFDVGDPPARRVHMCWVLVDGKKAPGTLGIDSYAWSPDGRKLAYVAFPACEIAEDRSRVGDCFLVIDGKKGSKQHLVTQPVWSPDSSHVLATAETKGQYVLLLDNRPFAQGSRYEGPVFSPDGGRIAYACELPQDGALAADFAKAKWFVACGDRRLGLDFGNAGSPAFSPDGKHIAFKAEKSGRVGIAVDDAAARCDWAFVTTPLFSPDGAHLAFAASNDCAVAPGYLVLRMGESLVTGGSWQSVLDGKPSGKRFGALRDLAFSPDSKRLAFRARSGEKWRIVCGTQESAEFDFVGPPQFSPDSSRVAFGVRKGREFAWAVLALD